MDFHRLADFKAVIFVIIKHTVETAVDADIIRTEVFISRAHRVCGFVTVRRANHGEVRHSASDGQIHNRVVGGARLTERGTGMGRDDFRVDILIANVGVQLIRRAKRSEYREGGSKRHKARSRHTGRNADHVLFGNTDVEHTLGISVCKVGQFGGSCKVSGDCNNLFMFPGKLREGFAVNFRSGKFRRFDNIVNKSSGHYSNSFPQRAMRSALYSSKSLAATFAISSSMAP